MRAALFLRDAHNWRRGGAARAFVAAGPPNAQGWCHIASVADPPQGGAQQVPSQPYRNFVNLSSSGNNNLETCMPLRTG